jgi:hypothetical protein
MILSPEDAMEFVDEEFLSVLGVNDSITAIL